MKRALGLLGSIVAASLAGSGCGDNVVPQGLAPDQLLLRLRALPGVTAYEAPTQQDGYHYYVLHVTQPVDHNDPAQGTFQQEVSLLHRSDLAPVPMIVHTSGYSDYYLDRPVELTKLLAANQVSIEHRYFGSSRPMPTDWENLTIEQMADDEHAIISALRTIYDGAFLTTGGSKGGMTAVYHRRFFPDDVDGTVAYVAPLSYGAPDARYLGFVDTLQTPAACRQAVRAAAVEMLANRRDAIQARAELQTAHAYTRVLIGPAVEVAIVSLEWTFWQYFGVDQCASVPPVTASDDELFAFLDKISPVSDSDDEQIGLFESYFYQSVEQLGYPDGTPGYLKSFMKYHPEDYAGELPTQDTEFDEMKAMLDIDDFVEHHGERLLFIYGEWDPWTGGQFVLGNASDSEILTQPEGTHGARIMNLDASDRALAFAKLEAWTGVAPEVSRVRRAGDKIEDEDQAWEREIKGQPRRMPPALVRAPRARK
jgi:PS-10 peptidase S37